MVDIYSEGVIHADEVKDGSTKYQNKDMKLTFFSRAIMRDR